MTQKQRNAGLLLRLDRMRAECGSLYSVITGGMGAPVEPFEIPGALDRSAVSRGRNAHESLAPYRQIVCYFSLHKAGCTRAQAEAIHAMHAAVIEELWPVAAVDFVTAVRAAQISDTTEDVCETGSLTEPESIARLDRWIESMQLHIGDAIVAIAAARRRRDELLKRRGLIAA